MSSSDISLPNSVIVVFKILSNSTGLRKLICPLDINLHFLIPFIVRNLLLRLSLAY